MYIVHEDSVHVSQRTQSASITKTNQWTLCREMRVDYCIRHTWTHYAGKRQRFTVKHGGKCS